MQGKGKWDLYLVQEKQKCVHKTSWGLYFFALRFFTKSIVQRIADSTVQYIETVVYAVSQKVIGFQQD